MMKKIIAILLIVLSLLALCACGGKEDVTAQIPQQLEEDIPNAYVGDTIIEDKADYSQSVEVSQREMTFYINGVKFSFSEFEKTNEVSTKFEGGTLTAFVEDGKFSKCTVSKEGGNEIHTFDSEGKCIGYEKTTRDEYGNITMFVSYDESGALSGFYTADYEKEACRITEKQEFNGTYDLVRVTKYYYSDVGKLTKEAIYGADLKLIEVKEY